MQELKIPYPHNLPTNPETFKLIVEIDGIQTAIIDTNTKDEIGEIEVNFSPSFIPGESENVEYLLVSEKLEVTITYKNPIKL